jgi:hypothetical protein
MTTGVADVLLRRAIWHRLGIRDTKGIKVAANRDPSSMPANVTEQSSASRQGPTREAGNCQSIHNNLGGAELFST